MNERMTIESALRHISTWEGADVMHRAKWLLENDPQFTSQDGTITIEQVAELQKESWRTCREVDDVIPLPIAAILWTKAGLPVNTVLDWIERRYGRYVRICAIMGIVGDPRQFLDYRDESLIPNPWLLRDFALSNLVHNDAFTEIAHQIYL